MFNDYGEDMPSLSNISLGFFLVYGFYDLTYHFFNGHYPKQIFTFCHSRVHKSWANVRDTDTPVFVGSLAQCFHIIDLVSL